MTKLEFVSTFWPAMLVAASAVVFVALSIYAAAKHERRVIAAAAETERDCAREDHVSSDQAVLHLAGLGGAS